MSTKAVHALTGLLAGIALAYSAKASLPVGACIVLGAIAGSSAPDWMEIARWEEKRHWFSKNEHTRRSLIPHRTITHTLSVWILLCIFSVYWLMTTSYNIFNYCFVGFLASALVHLLLDSRTPMGIPLLPFGKRYRLVGLKLEAAHSVEKPRGWL